MVWAVVLASPEADFDQVGRAFADALLDLVIPDVKLHALHVDHLGADELLYLGPDENISNRLIGWIVERARQRGHPMPDAFMSSKPTAGINHKEYGVTSEGVTVFLEYALRAVGINPRNQPFTVKMTGGPDGDVAGNEILILHREFGNNVRILGIADGSGIAEDPDGLDITELTQLVKSALPISSFDPERLSSDGRVVGIDQPGGVNLRNTLHNRIRADAFIPGGGRPSTINDTNWRAFLDRDGNPSARVIVEGANLFLSPQVRTHLSEKGVVIIKDSSANKCGVICSSYEIIASMLLDEKTFVDLKPRFVDEVLARLRALAELEARTLFHEHLHKPSSHLPELSERLSRAINNATDAIAGSITTLQGSHPELVRQLVVNHLPPSLFERSGEQTFERIPVAYLHRVVASSLASRIVYREGLDWLESMPAQAIATLAERYLAEESQIQALARQVRSSQLEHRKRIAMLLETGGVAAALRTQAD
jgi:glutamate dehydrogenase